VSEGTRTPDRLDHNQELYQLSYAHRGGLNLAVVASSVDLQVLVAQRQAISWPELASAHPHAIHTRAVG
jgi:hypothetical protein